MSHYVGYPLICRSFGMRVRRQSDGSNAPAAPVHNSNSVLVAESESDFQLGGDVEQQLRRIERSFAELLGVGQAGVDRD